MSAMTSLAFVRGIRRWSCGEFRNTENVSIWWRDRVVCKLMYSCRLKWDVNWIVVLNCLFFFFVHSLFELIITCRLCVIYIMEDSDWSLHADVDLDVRKKPLILNLTTHSYPNNIFFCKLLRFLDIHSLLWRHNGRDGVSNHQLHGCLLKRSFRPRSKKASKLRVTGLCAGNSPVTGEFPAQMASNAENVSIWWRHHGKGS